MFCAVQPPPSKKLAGTVAAFSGALSRIGGTFRGAYPLPSR